jgi:hypothetical protein
MVKRTADRPGERVRTLRCAHCGEDYTPLRRHQRFCRPSCRLAAFRAPCGQRRLPLDDPDDLFRVPFE